MTTHSTLLELKDGELQPITLKMIKADSYYWSIKHVAQRSNVIVYTIKHHLMKYWKEDIDKADNGDEAPRPGYRRVSDEGDIFDDICYVQSVAIARKNGLVGPRCSFGLYHPKNTAERLGITLIPCKKWPTINTLRNDDLIQYII